jgi:stearoyl-CoA desaturase (delta-9 desaturase)
MVFILSIIPIFGILGTSIYTYYNGFVWQEPLMLIIFWFLSGMGITMGYHRLFAHKSFKTNKIIEWILMILGSMAFENTILKWVSDHRTHHSKAETNEDPYSITEGFWHAHIGWILKKTPYEKERIKGVRDLEKNSAIQFQNRYYFHIGLFFGICVPFIIGSFYGRPLGAVLWAGFLRITLVHHATFFINSLCHYVGKRPYNFHSTARDSWFVSLFTFGEGYHNYHHTFQWDYRNGIKWFAFDPSKWLINLFYFLGLTYDLKKAQDYEIWENNLRSLNGQLSTKYIESAQYCKKLYHKKIANLQNKTKQILLSWKDMEMKYKNSYNKDLLDAKAVLDKINSNRKNYKSQLRLIKKELNSILLNIEGRRIFIKLN